jgi:hypothetical protein
MISLFLLASMQNIIEIPSTTERSGWTECIKKKLKHRGILDRTNVTDQTECAKQRKKENYVILSKRQPKRCHFGKKKHKNKKHLEDDLLDDPLELLCVCLVALIRTNQAHMMQIIIFAWSGLH